MARINSINNEADSLSLPATTPTVGQINLGAKRMLQAYGVSNVFLGEDSGNFVTASGNTNAAVGYHTLLALTSGTGNSALGSSALSSVTSGNFNVGIGIGTLPSLSTGQRNAGFGTEALPDLGTGSYNIGIGNRAGDAYHTSESSNIVISNIGSVGESNKIRIGTEGTGNGQQNTCFIAGIINQAVDGSPVVVASTGQLSVGKGIGAYAEETGATKTIVVGYEYGANRGGGVAFALPATAAVGSRCAITGIAGLWSITQAANQYISLFDLTTTVGVGGSMTAINAGNCVTCTCIVANNGWRVTSAIGDLTIV